MKNFIFTIFLLLFAASCIKNQERHGYSFELAETQIISEGITDKERVLRIMGSPTIISDLDSSQTWIYYSEEIEQILFFIPKVKERTILTLKFDDSQIIKSIEKFDLSDAKKDLKFSQKYTKVESNKIGFFKSLFANVGQVRAVQ